MNDFFRELVIIYGSTTIASLLFNRLYFMRKNKKAFEQSKRKLIYKDLSMKCYIAYETFEKSYDSSRNISRIVSMIPIIQIPYTVNNIIKSQEKYNETYDEDIALINKEELFARRQFLEEIKVAKSLPKNIKIKLEDSEYLPSEEDLREVINFNKSKNLVNKKSLINKK